MKVMSMVKIPELCTKNWKIVYSTDFAVIMHKLRAPFYADICSLKYSKTVKFYYQWFLTVHSKQRFF